MKTKLTYLLMIIMTMTMALGFTSCGDDDDDVPTGGVAMIVGTWTTSDGSITFVFNSNGTGSQTTGAGVPMNFSYTASIRSEVTIVRIEYAGATQATEWEVSRTGDILDLSRNGEYLRLYKK